MELDRDVEIVHLYHCKSQGSQYNSINSDKALYIKASAYVDDINTHHNVTNKQQTLEDIMKHDFKQWKSILEVGVHWQWRNAISTRQGGIFITLDDLK